VVVEGHGAKALLFGCTLSTVLKSNFVTDRTALTVLRGAHLICRHVTVDSDGVSIYGGGKATISLRDTSLCSTNAGGLVVAAGVEALLIEATVCNCKESGVKVSANSRLCAHQSHFSKNGRCGVELFASSLALVGCLASNNLAGGLLLSSSNGSATWCHFLQNRLANVTLLDSSVLSLTDSVVSASKASGVFISGVNSVLYNQRCIYQNNAIAAYETDNNGSFVQLDG